VRTTTELAVWVARYDIPVPREIDNPPTVVENPGRRKGQGVASGRRQDHCSRLSIDSSISHLPKACARRKHTRGARVTWKSTDSAANGNIEWGCEIGAYNRRRNQCPKQSVNFKK
jgi:hypothetical protein